MNTLHMNRELHRCHMHIEPITFIQRENRLETERKTGDDDREYRGV